MYDSWDMVRDRCNYFSFWVIFCPFTPLTAQKINILKKWKKHLETSSLYKWVPKLWSDDIWFLRYDAWRTDGQTDRQKKWLQEVGAPPNNHFKHKNKKVTPSWLKLKPKPSPCPFFSICSRINPSIILQTGQGFIFKFMSFYDWQKF